MLKNTNNTDTIFTRAQTLAVGRSQKVCLLFFSLVPCLSAQVKKYVFSTNETFAAFSYEVMIYG